MYYCIYLIIYYVYTCILSLPRELPEDLLRLQPPKSSLKTPLITMSATHIPEMDKQLARWVKAHLQLNQLLTHLIVLHPLCTIFVDIYNVLTQIVRDIDVTYVDFCTRENQHSWGIIGKPTKGVQNTHASVVPLAWNVSPIWTDVNRHGDM